MSITLNGIWAHAWRLSKEDRLALSKMLVESLDESESDLKKRAAADIDKFFGGWSDDPRSAEECMSEIRESRTMNTLYMQ